MRLVEQGSMKVRVDHVSTPTCQSTDRFEVKMNKEKVLLLLFSRILIRCWVTVECISVKSVGQNSVIQGLLLGLYNKAG